MKKVLVTVVSAAVELVYTKGALIDHATQNTDGTVTAYMWRTTVPNGWNLRC